MRLKNVLKNRRAQATIEYILIFIILLLGTAVVFGGYKLGDNSFVNCELNIKSAFSRVVDNAITAINNNGY